MAAAPNLAAWLTAVSMALLVTWLAFRGGRRRSAINEAIHELRRPLQALALIQSTESGGVRESSMRLAAAALEKLDQEVNGGAPVARTERVECAELLQAAVARWETGALVEGAELELREPELDASVEGDPAELAQALDNLIVNAIEHGGGRILVDGVGGGDRVRLVVANSGPSRHRASLKRGDAFSIAIERFSGRRRRGHGLSVVRRTAARHGGRFVLEHTAGGCRAVLELPRMAVPRVERVG